MTTALPQDQVLKLGALLFKHGYRPYAVRKHTEPLLDRMVSGGEEQTRLGQYLSGVEGTNIAFLIGSDPEFPEAPEKIAKKTLKVGITVERFLREHAKIFKIPLPETPMHHTRDLQSGVMNINIQPFLDEPEKFDAMLTTLSRRKFLGDVFELGAAAAGFEVNRRIAAYAHDKGQEKITEHNQLNTTPMDDDKRKERQAKLREESNIAHGVEFASYAGELGSAAGGAAKANTMLFPDDPYESWEHFKNSVEHNIGPLSRNAEPPSIKGRPR